MTNFIINLDIDNLEDESIERYEKYFTCEEIKNLYEGVIDLVNNIKFSNQKFLNEDA